MRILFDNGTPRQLRRHLFGHDVLITTDQGIRYQQNMSNRRVAVVVLMNTAWPRISMRTETIRNALEGIQPEELREVPI